MVAPGAIVETLEFYPFLTPEATLIYLVNPTTNLTVNCALPFDIQYS